PQPGFARLQKTLGLARDTAGVLVCGRSADRFPVKGNPARAGESDQGVSSDRLPTDGRSSLPARVANLGQLRVAEVSACSEVRLYRQNGPERFWPLGRPFAFALTHDVETAEGQAFVRTVADLDASYGFRSSFNFVAEDYPLDKDLIDELRERGFEIGLHGLRHNGKTFRSHTDFLRQAKRINHHLRSLKAVGFRTPLTHRHPGWMQALDIE